MSRILTEPAGRRYRRSRGRRVAAPVIGVLLSLALTGCSHDTTEQFKRLGLPAPGSDRTVYIHDLWIGSWIAAMIVGVFVWGLIFWAVVRYRRRSDDDLPTQVRYNLPIEVLYTIAPIVVVAVLFFFTVEKQNKVLAEVVHPDHTVIVTAQQWAWTFNYQNEPGAGGVDVYDAGTTAQEPTLWLVKDQSVTFTLHSPDVVHSFWVPSFYFKRDVLPGRDQSFSLTPTVAGDFVGRCAELCGYQHSRMLFHVHVTTRDAFDQHMKQLADPNGLNQTGTLLGGGESTTIPGLEATQESGQ